MAKKVSISIEGQSFQLTQDAARGVLGQIAVQLREVIAGGRPRSGRRCPCGAMSAGRAKQRYHHCVAPGEKEEKVEPGEKGKKSPAGKRGKREKGKSLAT